MKSLVTILLRLSCFVLLCSLLLTCSSRKDMVLFYDSVAAAEADQLELGLQQMSDSMTLYNYLNCEIMCFIGVRDGFGYFSKIDSIPVLSPSIFCSTVWATVPSDRDDLLFEGADHSLGRKEAIEKFKELQSLLNAKFGKPHTVINTVDYEDENAIVVGEDQAFAKITWHLKEDVRWSVTLNFTKGNDESFVVGFGPHRGF